MSAITRFLPKNHLSRVVGHLVHIRLPAFLNKFVIAKFAKAYRINLAEAEFPIEKYASLGDFFVRRLKPGLRPVGASWALHPADAVITQAGKITEGRLVQAKGKFYTLETFTQDSEAMKKYADGYFLTYYLCPTDYHRVHSPVSGNIKRVTHIPGALWPVNPWSTENIPELFSVNERILVEIETDRGLVGVMFVGATNVGKIILAFDTDIVGNQPGPAGKIVKEYAALKIKKGDELGMFRMGSTVVMMYGKTALQNLDSENYLNKGVKVNSAFI